MKKILCILLTVITIFSLSACKPSTDGQNNGQVNVDSTENQTPDNPDTTQTDFPEFKQLPMVSVSLPVTTDAAKADDGTVIFEYTHQDIVLSINDSNVADDVINDFRARVANTQSYADSVLAQAQQEYKGSSNWIAYQYSIAYKPTRIDSGVLSLFGADASYSGSSHPTDHYSAANYDLVTGDVLTLSDILAKDVTSKTLSNAALEVLAAQIDEYRLFTGYESIVSERFNRKFTTDQSWYFSNKGLCFYFVPYEIAPRASGVVVAEIPYEKLLGILKDEYFPAERQPASGDIIPEPMTTESLSKFTQFSDVILDSNADTFLLYTDYAVYNVTLQTAKKDKYGVITALYTVFATSSLTPGDAIMIQGNPTVETEYLILSYESAGEIIKMNLFKDDTGTIKIQSTLP